MPAQVEHEPAFARAVAGEAVPAAPHSELDSALVCKRHDGRHCRIVDGPNDRGRMLVDLRVEDPTRSLVRGIVRADDLSSELEAKPSEVEPRLQCRTHRNPPSSITPKGSPSAHAPRSRAHPFSRVRLSELG